MTNPFLAPCCAGYERRFSTKKPSVLHEMCIRDRLMALQPFCGEHRRKKVEEAAQLLRIIRLLPLLEDKPPAG